MYATTDPMKKIKAAAASDGVDESPIAEFIIETIINTAAFATARRYAERQRLPLARKAFSLDPICEGLEFIASLTAGY